MEMIIHSVTHLTIIT